MTILSQDEKPRAAEWKAALAMFRFPNVRAAAVIVLLCGTGAAHNSHFLSPSNMWSALSIAAMLSIASAGQTLVILSGNQGIDLSVGTVMTLAALLESGIAGSSDAALPWATAIAVGVGATVGLVNGLGIQLLRLYPLIMTLGVSFAGDGAALVYAQNRAPSMPSRVIETLGAGRLFGVPWIVILAVAASVALTWLLTGQRYGKKLYFVGANERAARVAGINTGRVIVATYVLSGALSALAGVVLFGFAGSVNLSLGTPYTMMSVAAVVIGGASLSGGRGSFLGTVMGAIIFSLLTNLLIQLGFNSALRYVASGVVLFLVLLTISRERT